MSELPFEALPVFVGVSLVSGLAFLQWMKKPFPPKEDKNYKANTKEGFSMKKVPNDIDIIVIGSGLSGLSTASMLAQEGKKCLVLEQHDVAGGCTHTYEDHGYEFDVGLHYIGQFGKGSFCRFLIDYISGGTIEFERMEPYFDVLKMGDEDTFKVHSCWKKFKADLKERFPEEAVAIDKFFSLCEYCRFLATVYMFSKLLPSPLYNLFHYVMQRPFRIFKKTTTEVLDSLTSNVKLKWIMGYSGFAYGDIPRVSAFWVQAMCLDHFRGGGYYPVGGPSMFAQKLIPVIEKSGGKVLVRARVSELMIENDRAVGVVVKGNKIYAKQAVVSTIGGPNTYKYLIPKTHHDLVQDELEALKLPFVQSGFREGNSQASLVIGLKASKEELKLPKRNVWQFRAYDHNKAQDEYGDDMNKIPLVYMSFSTKDSTYTDRYPGRQTVMMLIPQVYDHVQEFENERIHNRSEAYEERKEKWKQIMMKALEKNFPQVMPYVDFSLMGTAVTNNFYLGNYKGATLGMAHSPERFEQQWLRPTTAIKGLYMGGQDVFVSGIVGAMCSAIFTSIILNVKVALRIVPKAIWYFYTSKHLYPTDE